MEVPRNENGLFVGAIQIQSGDKTRTFNGLFDTGSNTCACSYRVITALRARPTSYDRVANTSKAIHALGYSLRVGFDEKMTMTHVYRLPLELPNIDFVLGMSVLSHCTLTFKPDGLSAKWRS